MKNLKLYDNLTGFIKLITFCELLKNSIQDAIQLKQSLTLFYIDIDNFIMINDTLGHFAGDEVLIEISRRLRKLLHRDMIIARGDQDEFIILVPELNEDQIVELANSILTSLNQPYFVTIEDIFLTVSIGISNLTDSETNADQLLSEAQHALIHAREQRPNNIYIFSRKK